MPDIVLKDGSGTPQTYSGTTAVGMDTVDGGVAIFVSEDIAKKNIPWSNITRKPFGELPRLESAELAFGKIDEDLNSYGSELPGVWDIALGESYKITWDGTEYTCTCKDFTSEGIGIGETFFLGNTTKFWGGGLGEDTGEPFIIVISQDSKQYGAAYIETTDTSATHTVSILPVDVRRMEEKYLPEGMATEQYVQDAIAKIPSGGGGSATEVIVPEREITFTIGSDGYEFTSEDDALIEAMRNVESGGEYQISFGDESYTCTEMGKDFANFIGQDFSNGNDFIRVFGNLAMIVPEVFPDTGEPFAITSAQMTETDAEGNTVTDKMFDVLYFIEPADESVTVAFGIQRAAAVVPVDAFVGGGDKEIVPETQMRFTANGDWAMSGVEPGKQNIADAVSHRGSFRVLWNAREYLCTKKAINGYWCIGNLSIIYSTMEDTGEPFLIGLTHDEGDNSFIIFAKEQLESATVGIWVVRGGRIRLNTKYAPAVPEFDLAAMGLPAVPVTGGAVQALCDTQKLREALDRGTIKVSFLVDAAGEAPESVSTIADAAYHGGAHRISFLSVFSENPAFITITVKEEGVTAKAQTLQTMTTT